MQNLMEKWNTPSGRRLLVAGIVALLTFSLILGLTQIGRGPRMALLYAGLDAEASGQVLAALDQQGVAYRVNGTAIEVDAAQRDTLRMSLASDGLPANGARGYELLDDLSGFGTTSQMFDAAYWRAKEGELARTIDAVPGVKKARVHISQGNKDAFGRGTAPSASVTLSTANGSLPAQTARALKHLVASAVSGLKPEHVVIFETSTGLIATAAEEDPASRNAADGHAESIRRSVERLLEARVGPGRAVVEVSVELITEREQITERRIDPDTRVAISSEVEESTRQDRQNAADVTVASNLPENDARTDQQGQSQANQTRERVNYEVSQTHRELLRTPGGIRRMSVAVLIDGEVTTAADGSRSWAPRSDTELQALREIVASATGLDEARADVLTLRSLELRGPDIPNAPEPEATVAAMADRNLMLLVGVALAVTLLVVALWVLSRRKRRNSLPSPALLASGPSPAALPDPQNAAASTASMALDNFSMPQLSVVDFIEPPQLTDDPASRLRRLIHERQAESLEILKTWLDPQEERA